MVWCGEAHAHVDLGPMFWTDSPRRDFPHIVLGYQDEEPSQPEIHDADSLAEPARMESIWVVPVFSLDVFPTVPLSSDVCPKRKRNPTPSGCA